MIKTASKLMKGNAIKEIGMGSIVGFGINAGFAYGDYRSAREEGYSHAGAATRAIGTSILTDIIGPGKYMAIQAAAAVPSALVSGVEELNKMARGMSRNSMNKPFQNATFADSQQAYTMRQAGQAIARASRYNTQQAMLGNEAQYMKL